MNKALKTVLEQEGKIADLEMWESKIDFSQIQEPIELDG